MQGGAEVRMILTKCFQCRRRTEPSGEQLMAELPPPRVTPEGPPIAFTSADYFGPLVVKQGRNHIKRYRCLLHV